MTSNAIRNQEALVASIQAGAPVKFVFFWGHEPARPDEIGKHCLSQWFPRGFQVDGLAYATAEHFMMAEKARLFGDTLAERKILAAPSPGAAKRFGRDVRGFDETAWTNARVPIAVRGNFEKFKQNPDIGYFLTETKSRILVEASPVDRIWGIGLEERDSRARDPTLWRGLNLLGFALMEVRDLLAR